MYFALHAFYSILSVSGGVSVKVSFFFIFLIHTQMDCRKHIWSMERTTIFTVVTKYCNPNDVEERPESVKYFKK